jgi:hypothetical protein
MSAGEYSVGPFIRTVMADIPTEQDADFNKWYNEVHIPEICACPGYIGARRFVAAEGSPRYLAVYEIESADALKTPELLAARGWGRFEEHVKNVQLGLYRELIRHIER